MKKTACNLFLNLSFSLLALSAFAQGATNESNSMKLKMIEERNKQLEIQRISDSLDRIIKIQNQEQSTGMQAQSQRILDMQTQTMLLEKEKEQSGNINSAINENPGMDLQKEILGSNLTQQDLARSQQIIDPSQQSPDMDELNRSELSKIIGSIPPVIVFGFFGLIIVLVINFIFKK